MSIITDYRPTKWEEVVGQGRIVKSLKQLLESGSVPHCYLFHGEPGLGKTTVARILARELGCKGADLVEVDAATFSGVDSIRKISSRQHYYPVSSSVAVTVIDECQALSATAWKALLKPLEEAPKHFYWIFCTTEPVKVPKNIKTRCHEYGFVQVPRNDLLDLLEEVAEEEEIQLDDKQLSVIVQASRGSPRQALVYMSMCRACETVKDVQSVLREGFEHMEAINLARHLLFESRPTFKSALDIINSFKDETTAESVRLTILNYCANVLLGKKSYKNPERILAVMEEFSQPFFQAEKMAPVIIAIGRLLLD